LKKLLYILFAIQISLLTLYAQPVNEEWVRTYSSGYPNNDFINAMTLDTSGNIIVTGSVTTSTQNGNFCTIKYDQSGIQQWVAFYNGPGTNSIDDAVAITVDKKGFIYVTGNSEETGFGTDAFCTIKYSPSGSQIWAVRYHRTPHFYDDPQAIAVDKYGNVYVTGMSSSDGSYYGYDYLTLKYDSSGALKWDRYYNGPVNNSDLARSIAVDDSCNIYITGESATYQNTGGYCTIKYNTNGDSIWVRRYDGLPGGGHPNLGKKLVIDKWSNVYVTGISYTSITHEYSTIKYSSQGVQQWVSNYRNPTNGFSEPYAIAVDSNLNVFVTGKTSGTGISDYATVKYNIDGVQQWVKIYNGPGNSYDEAHGISVDMQGGTYVTGWSQDSSQQNIFMTIKYDSSGVLKWQMSHAGMGEAVKVDKNYNVYIAGRSLVPSKYTTIKYSQLVGIHSISKKIPEQFKLYQNYPNPFNPSTKIKFDISPSRGARGVTTRLIIYDILGREIAVLVNANLNPGTYEVEFDGSNHPSGIYFYRLTAGEYNECKKMVLIK
jgi:hypothetical protein